MVISKYPQIKDKSIAFFDDEIIAKFRNPGIVDILSAGGMLHEKYDAEQRLSFGFHLNLSGVELDPKPRKISSTGINVIRDGPVENERL